jgi:hypothetical protein
MASKYTITYNGVGYGEGRSITRFSDLAKVAEYVKGRWEGTDYQDSAASFHNDYGIFTLRGCTLADLGIGKFVPPADKRSIDELVAAGRFVVVLSIPKYDGRDAHYATEFHAHSHHATREEAEIAADVEILRSGGIESMGDIDISIRPPKPYVQPEHYSSFNEDIPF